MDPLAHGLTGSALAVAALPAVARKHTARVIGAGALLGNLPDIDFATLAISEEVWLYHHRGFTHSLPGLLVMVPAGVWILRKVLAPLGSVDAMQLIYDKLLSTKSNKDFLKSMELSSM